MMNKRNLKRTIWWRESILFFAAFFCICIVFTSCKKRKNTIGQNALPPGSEMNSNGVDTFQIKAYSVHDTKVITKNPAVNDLGSYVDPTFGKVEANFYTQLTLSGFSPDFGDLNDMTIDSAVMAFEYGGYYGEISAQNFEVYEITDNLSKDSSYTNTSTVAVGSQNLVPLNKGLITPNLDDPAVVGGDTLNPELRIPIDTNFARHLLQIAQGSTDAASFLNDFKGLFFKVNNPTQTAGEGSILYLETANSASKLTVYYHTAEGQNKFDFLVTGDEMDFNHLSSDFTGTPVEQVINDTVSGNLQFFTQAFTTRAKIDFPSINNLPKNCIIHSAKLELPINYYVGSDYFPSQEITVSAQLFKNDDNKYLLSNVTYNPLARSYTIDLRTYVQNVLNGQIVNNGIYVSPKHFISTAERMIFNGINTPYKKQPKLTIVYTVL